MRAFARTVGIAFLLLAWFAVPASSAAADEDMVARLEGLRAADIRLGSVLFRLAKANDALCEKHGPLTGLIVHGRASYQRDIRDVAISHFHFESPIGVEGVVPDSPAARAGIRPDDSIVAIGASQIKPDETREAALAMIDAAGLAKPLTLTIRRAGRASAVTINSVEGCLAHAEIDVSGDLNAATDGDTIQVDSGLINLVAADDAALAAIVAHELAHIVLDHPARLTAAHVDRGLFKGFGRSARLFKRTEREADRLSVTLLANAGYDPQTAARYWLTYGPKLDDHGGLGSTHPSWRERARLIGEEAERVVHEAGRPIIPAWIASRDQPLR